MKKRVLKIQSVFVLPDDFDGTMEEAINLQRNYIRFCVKNEFSDWDINLIKLTFDNNEPYVGCARICDVENPAPGHYMYSNVKEVNK